MTKLKVGDKVRFIEDYMDYKKGDIVEVEGFWSEGINYIGEGNSTGCYFSRVELVETKPTKNQRITALENEVAELKLIVHELRGKKSIEPSTTNTVEDKPLTPNQQRAEIIEKAKKFVKQNLANGRTSNRTAEKGNSTYRDNYYEVDFFVKEGKITAVVYWLVSNERRIVEPSNVGRAKCSPNDVFNEHIGKAIALGRALGLDVSEFEQAVQPTIAVGQIVHSGMTIYEVLTLENIFGNVKYKDENGYWQDAEGGYLPAETWYTIINDTNAKYEVF
ncbi:hypothetical protein [Lysinibacillus sphaericus]|uniref:hypothetical protein n=1 Tax=Lysinibacillus sphaericus TaxID=1421 RepID=UPI003D7FF8A7